MNDNLRDKVGLFIVFAASATLFYIVSSVSTQLISPFSDFAPVIKAAAVLFGFASVASPIYIELRQRIVPTEGGSE